MHYWVNCAFHREGVDLIPTWSRNRDRWQSLAPRGISAIRRDRRIAGVMLGEGFGLRKVSGQAPSSGWQADGIRLPLSSLTPRGVGKRIVVRGNNHTMAKPWNRTTPTQLHTLDSETPESHTFQCKVHNFFHWITFSRGSLIFWKMQKLAEVRSVWDSWSVLLYFVLFKPELETQLSSSSKRILLTIFRFPPFSCVLPSSSAYSPLVRHYFHKILVFLWALFILHVILLKF